MNQHPHAVADHDRRQHLTTTELRDLIRHFFPPHHFGSKVVKKRTVLFKTMSGIYGRALDATSSDETQRRGTLWKIRQWKRLAPHGVRAMRGILRHPVSGISDVDPHGTIRGHPACIATTGATRDEGQEKQCCESSGGQWVRGKALPRGNRGTEWKRRRLIAIIHRLRSRMEATL